MAFDEGMAQILRDELADLDTVEKKMFGGLCFMHRGHMLAGIYKGGAMFRVGKAQMATALAMPGVTQLHLTADRPMPGMVACADTALADDGQRHALVTLARAFNLSQPAK